MVCSHCGTPLTANSRFCRGCGLRVGDGAPGDADDGATLVVPAHDVARTVVVTPPPAWPDPDDEPPTGAVSVVPEGGSFLPGSHEFRAQPTVVVSADEVRRLVSPDPPSPPAVARGPADTGELEWPERWPRDDTKEAAPALDLERTAVVPAFTGDETVVVRAAVDPAGTVTVPAAVDPASTVVVPVFDPASTVAVPRVADPAGTMAVPVASEPEPSAIEDTAPLPVLPGLDALPPPASAPEAGLSGAPPSDPASAWWASAAERTAAMRAPDPPPGSAAAPVPPDEPSPIAEPPTAPLVLEALSAPGGALPPPMGDTTPAPSEPVHVEPPPLPAPADPLPTPVADTPSVPPAAAPPAAAPAPPVPVVPAPAASAVPAPVTRPALGGSATKLAAWVATLALVAALGVIAARRWVVESPGASAAPVATATPAAPAPDATTPAPAAPVRPSCETERALKSTPGTGEARLQVTNKTSAPVVVHWLNLAGVREKWFEVSPGAMRSQRTPPTYRWVVARADGTCLAVISGQGSVVVE